MAKPSWADFGSIWKTIREVDINAIRHDAERSVAIVCVGQPAALWQVDRLLREGPDRFAPQPDPLAVVRLDEAGRYLDYIRTADLLVLALDAAPVMDAGDLDGLRTLSASARPAQVVLLVGGGAGGDGPVGPGIGVSGADPAVLASTAWAPYLDARLAQFVDPDTPGAGLRVAGAVFDALPAEARLAAARRLPGLRPLYAQRLTSEVSVSNAAFALASGVPSLVPFLGIPISAADTIVLTKNQALMVYRLALACGAPPEFQRRMLEITPVIGGAVLWRQIAGALVGLVPGYGIVPKTAVAFGGTYVVGLAATRYYEAGILTDEERKRITKEAAGRAREAATMMVEQARAAGDKAGAQTRSTATAVAVRARATRDKAGGQLKGAAAAVGGRSRATRDKAAETVRAAGRKVTRRGKADPGADPVPWPEVPPQAPAGTATWPEVPPEPPPVPGEK